MPTSLDTVDISNLADTFKQSLPDSFLSLGPDFYTKVPATPVPNPYLVGFSADAAALLGFEARIAHDPAFVAWFAGNALSETSKKMPFATVYAGHQFGIWAGQLGDGRALNLGEIEHGQSHYEVQLKGAGPTPYSRMGDGRAVLRSSIREFLCSEAMHYLGVPTTRALCVIGSDLPVRRECVETAAITTRIAPSFVRFGHFEHFYARNRPDLIALLAKHIITHHYPDCDNTDTPYLALLKAVTWRTADLIAHWQAIGFCHGVMNTDNMSILGLTIDYGPYGFIDGFNFEHICNHSDTTGRYAYQKQPEIAYWNLFCLAQALLPIISIETQSASDKQDALEEIRAVLGEFKPRFMQSLQTRMCAKLGLARRHDGDAGLIDQLLKIMHENRADFTLTFRWLAQVSQHDTHGDASVSSLFTTDYAAFHAWLQTYRARLAYEGRDDSQRASAMNCVNPQYILRNHLVEQAIELAQEKNFSEVERLLNVLRRPFNALPEYEAYAQLPPAWASSLQVSCSS